MKHLSQLTKKLPDHIFNFDDWYSPLFTKRFYRRWVQNPVKYLVWHFVCICIYVCMCMCVYIRIYLYICSNMLSFLAKRSILDVWRGVELAFTIFFMVTLNLIQKQFPRGAFFFQNVNHRRSTLINFKTRFFVEHLLMTASTYHCFSWRYYCFASTFVLLLRK